MSSLLGFVSDFTRFVRHFQGFVRDELDLFGRLDEKIQLDVSVRVVFSAANSIIAFVGSYSAP